MLGSIALAFTVLLPFVIKLTVLKTERVRKGEDRQITSRSLFTFYLTQTEGGGKEGGRNGAIDPCDIKNP